MVVMREFEGFAFGLGDGIICMLGIIIGVAAATANPSAVILAGIVGGVANSFANSAGFYISQSMERGIQTHYKNEKRNAEHVHTPKEIILSSVFSFFATIASLTILIAPFLLTDLWTAMALSFSIGIIILFLLGIYVARLMKASPLKVGVEFVIVGAIGAVASYSIGTIIQILLGG